MIKLYNHSKIKDEVILPILKQAFKLAELKGKLVVVITRGRRGGGKFFDSKNLKYKPYFGSQRFIKSDAGFVIINPYFSSLKDGLRSAEETCRTILHEFKHSSDYIQGLPFSHKEPYLKRPHEVRARFFASYEAKIDDELVLNLALELERIMK